MNEALRNTFIGFNDLFQALSTQKVIKAKDGINIAGNIISTKDFNDLYMQDIISMLLKYETTISPEFAPTKDLYQTLDVLSSPVLKGTKVPEAVKSFYKKLNDAISSKDENRKIVETGVTDYVQETSETPFFMLASMDREISRPENTPSPFKPLIPPSSYDLLDSSSPLLTQYGTKYDIEDILELAESGYLSEKAPMHFLIYKSLELQNTQEDNSKEQVSLTFQHAQNNYSEKKNNSDFQPTENTNSEEQTSSDFQPTKYNNSEDQTIYESILEFYSPEKHPKRMHTLMRNGEIDKEFSDLHYELLENVPETKKSNYIQDLVDEAQNLASTSNDYSNDLIEYANARIIPDTTLSGNTSSSKNITSKFLTSKFDAGEISLARVLEIYESNSQHFREIKTTILTPSKIEKAHSEGKLEDKALMYFPENSRAAYLQKSKASLSTIMYLFLQCDGITITELQKLLSKKPTESLDSYIEKGSHTSRIQELYENYLIDYGCIISLIANRIIPKEDLKEFHLKTSKEDVYNELQSTNEIEIKGASHIVPYSTTGAFIGPQTKETTEKSTALYKILGNISEDTQVNIPVISHKDDRNEPSFLNGYKVLPLKPANLVTFLPPEPTKPTYIMPYQETDYILHNNALPETWPENPVIQEVKATERMHEDILRIASQFEEAKKYLERLGYTEDLSFEEAMKIMTEEYQKIKTKGEI